LVEPRVLVDLAEALAYQPGAEIEREAVLVVAVAGRRDVVAHVPDHLRRGRAAEVVGADDAQLDRLCVVVGEAAAARLAFEGPALPDLELPGRRAVRARDADPVAVGEAVGGELGARLAQELDHRLGRVLLRLTALDRRELVAGQVPDVALAARLRVL